MSKVTITGTITEIGESKKIASGEVLQVVVNRKSHDPNTGKLKNEDHFPVQVFNPLKMNPAPDLIKGQKVRVEAYVNGRMSDKDGTPSYFCNLVAKSIVKV